MWPESGPDALIVLILSISTQQVLQTMFYGLYKTTEFITIFASSLPTTTSSSGSLTLPPMSSSHSSSLLIQSHPIGLLKMVLLLQFVVYVRWASFVYIDRQ